MALAVADVPYCYPGFNLEQSMQYLCETHGRCQNARSVVPFCVSEAKLCQLLMFKGQKNSDGQNLFRRVERTQQDATFNQYIKDNIQSKEVLI